MTEEFAYLDNRLEAQRKWHSDKAAWNRKRFYITEIITLVAGSMIPIINVRTKARAILIDGCLSC